MNNFSSFIIIDIYSNCSEWVVETIIQQSRRYIAFFDYELKVISAFNG